MSSQATEQHTIVSQEKWLEARRAFLKEEKELTRLRDTLAAKRRTLPWVKVDKPYVFQGPKGKATLADLFDGRSQLLVYHFMFGPGWGEGCRSCSFGCDHFNASLPHLKAKDISFVAVSSAPLAEFQPFKERLGWTFPWLSSAGSDFNHDYRVSFTAEEIKAGIDYNYQITNIPMDELPGISAFYRDGKTVYHTYSAYSRGLDMLIGAYNLIDLTPRGRNEDSDMTMNWVQYHDQYEHAEATV